MRKLPGCVAGTPGALFVLASATVGLQDDTRVAELELALVEAEQRLSKIGELELELRELSLERAKLVRKLQKSSPSRRLRAFAGRKLRGARRRAARVIRKP